MYLLICCALVTEETHVALEVVVKIACSVMIVETPSVFAVHPGRKLGIGLENGEISQPGTGEDVSKVSVTSLLGRRVRDWATSGCL